MKVFVVFGSSSDERVYGPLVEQLKENFSVEFEVISAHRNPIELGQALEQKEYDFVVAGAGLAAHLPGVVASKVNRPVFGVPVDAAFGGLDAFFSIVQMPFGVPVIACGANREKEIFSWALAGQNLTQSKFEKINVVVDPKIFDYEYAQMEWKRTCEYAQKREVELQVREEAVAGEVNIAMITDPNMVVDDPKDAFVLHTSLMEKTARQTPRQALDIFHCVHEKGGLWVGVNNTRNALCALLKWRDIL